MVSPVMRGSAIRIHHTRQVPTNEISWGPPCALESGAADWKRSVSVSLNRPRVPVCIKLLTALNFCATRRFKAPGTGIPSSRTGFIGLARQTAHSTSTRRVASFDHLVGAGNAGIACWTKLETTPPSFFNHSRYGTSRSFSTEIRKPRSVPSW